MKLLYENITLGNLRDTLPYFNDFPSMYFYHGTSSTSLDQDSIHSLDFRMRESPKDSLVFMHEAINRKAQEKFGVPIRNLMFVTANDGIASDYGNVFAVVPKGDKYALYVNQNYIDITDELNLEAKPFTWTFLKSAAWTLSNVPENYLRNWERDLQKLTSDFFFNDIFTARTLVIDLIKPSKKISPEDIVHGAVEGIRKRLQQPDFEELYRPLQDNLHMLYNVLITLIYEDIDKTASKYIDGTEEIYSQEDLHNSDSELMLYAPDGFYLVP